MGSVSTASVARTAVVAEITIPVTDSNRAAIAAAWGIGLKLGKLLIAA